MTQFPVTPGPDFSALAGEDGPVRPLDGEVELVVETSDASESSMNDWKPWIRSRPPHVPEWTLAAQESRTPISVDISFYKKQALTVRTLVRVATVIHNALPSSKKDASLFQFQYLMSSGQKGFEQKNPPNYTYSELVEEQLLNLERVEHDPKLMLSLKLAPSYELVVVDIDPLVDGEIHPMEAGLLKGLPDLLTMEGVPSNPQPLVFQTPRGLHLVYKVPANMKPKINHSQRKHFIRLGFEVELITSGNCVLAGANYRLLTPLDISASVPDLPYILQPLSQKTKKKVVLTSQITAGNRYNTLKEGVLTKQWVYLGNGAIVGWIHDHFCEKSPQGEGLKQPEIQYLRELAGKSWSKTAMNCEEEALAPSSQSYENPGVSPESIMVANRWPVYLSSQVALSSDPSILPTVSQSLRLARILQSDVWYDSQAMLPIRSVMAINTFVYGGTCGIARTIAGIVGGSCRFLVHNTDANEILFLCPTKRIWEPMAEGAFRSLVRRTMEGFVHPLFLGSDMVTKVVIETLDLLRAPNWGYLVSGHVYENGIKLLGIADLLEINPEFQLRTFVPCDYDAKASFTKETSSFFKNFSHYNPPNLLLLRVYFFTTLFNLATPSHFLYIQGPPSTGKSLMICYWEWLLGVGSVHRFEASQIDANFAFSGENQQLKTVVFEDADNTQSPARILSWLKERSTQTTLLVRKKFSNKSTSLSNVRYCMICNSFLMSKEVTEALDRRQIILQPKSISIKNVRPDMLQLLKQNTSAVQYWLDSTPRIFLKILKYSASMNYMSSSKDFSFNPVAAFLFDQQSFLFYTPGRHTSLSDIRADQMFTNTNVSGLFSTHFTAWYGSTLSNNRNEFSQREFEQILSELSRSSYYLPENGNGSYTEIMNFPRSKRVDRLVWLNVTFAETPETQEELKAENFPNLTIKMPIEGAVLALLHPKTMEVDDGSILGATAGISIHQKYPEIWLKTIFDIVKIGPDAHIEQTMGNYRARVEDIVNSLEEKARRRQSSYAAFSKPKMKQFSQEKPLPFPVSDPIEVDPNTDNEISPPLIASYPLESNYLRDEASFDWSLQELDLSKPIAFTPDNFVLNANSRAIDLYALAAAAQAETLRHNEATGDETNEEVFKPSRLFVSKRAYQKLSEVWVGSVDMNKQQYYTIDKNSTWEAVFENNASLTESVPSLIWEQDLLVDVVFFPPSSPSQTPLEVDMNTRTAPEVPFPSEIQTRTAQEVPIPSENAPPVPSPSEIQTRTAQEGLFPAEEAQEVSFPSEDAQEVPLPSKNAPPVPFPSQIQTKTAQEVPITSKKAKTVPFPSEVPLKSPPLSSTPPANKGAPIDSDFLFEAIKNTNKKGVAKIDISPLNRAKKIKASESVLAFLSANSIPVQSVLDPLFLNAVHKNGNALKIFNKQELNVSPQSDWVTYLGPRVEGWEGPPELLTDIKTHIEAAATKGGVELETLRKEILSKYVFLPFQVHLKKNPDLLQYAFDSKTNDLSYFLSLASHEWKLGFLTSNSWRKPFPGSRENEAFRERFSKWTEHCNVHNQINELLGPWLQSLTLVFSIFENMEDLAFNRISFSEKTGVQAGSFYWKKPKLLTPFATEYIGHSKTADPGRLLIQGTSFATFPRSFRKVAVNSLFKVISDAKEMTFFIVDIKGAHANFQSALLKTDTPLLYGMFKSGSGSEIWSSFVSMSGGSMSLADKPLMKTCFYAALNGGSIHNVSSLERHLHKTIKPGDELFDRVLGFALAFLKHPIAWEMGRVSDYWKTLNGRMYVPTRVEPILRLASAVDVKDSEKKALASNQTRKMQVALGDPLPFKLPSVYYSALEVIMMTRVLSFTYSYFSQENRPPVAYLQGIHDGMLFCSSNQVDLKELSNFVNERLNLFSVPILGLPVSVDVQEVDGNYWVSNQEDF